MLKHGVKSRKAVGSIIAILFIIGAIIIAFTIIEYNIISQGRLREIQEKQAEAERESLILTKAVSSIWDYDKALSELTINITNNYIEPVLVTGIVIYYTDKSYEILNGSLADVLGQRLVEAKIIEANGATTPICCLPRWLYTGATLTIKFRTGDKEPASITYATASTYAIASCSSKKYIPIIIGNITVKRNYSTTLLNVTSGSGTVAVLGYHGIANCPIDAEVTTGTLISGDAQSLCKNDDNYYTVEGASTQENWLQGWLYRRPIIITENAGVTLENYAVKITLDSTNFDFSKANPDGSDIRFTLDDGATLIPYWIQLWDNVGQQAIIWVKIPSIPAGGIVTVYMYYGNPAAASQSNIHETFVFGEDLEYDYDGDGDVDNDDLRLAGWSIVSERRGLWHVARPNTCKSPTHSWYYGRDPPDCDYDVGTTRGYILTPSIDLTSVTTGAKLIFYSRWQHEYFPWGDYDSMDVYISIDGGATWTRLWHRDCNEGPSFANWHYEEIDISAYTGYTVLIKFRFDSVDPLYNNYEGWHVDNVIIRYYVSPEPTATVGAEQTSEYKAEVKITHNISGISKALILLRIKASVSGKLKIYLYNVSSSTWDSWLSKDYTAPYEERYSVGPINLTDYKDVNGNVLVKIWFYTAESKPTIYINQEVLEYVIQYPAIYIGVGGSTIFYKYNITDETQSFLANVPYTFNTTSAITYDPRKEVVWAIFKNGELYLYNIHTDEWFLYDKLDITISNGVLMFCSESSLYIVAGGSSFYKYNIEAKTLTTLTSIPGYVKEYSVGALVDDTIYLVLGGGNSTFLAYNTTLDSWVFLEDTPTGYAVGLAYDQDRNVLWLLGKGGGLHYFDLREKTWHPYSTQIPYMPLSPGNRLVYYQGKLYHVRGDNTRELWIIYVGS